MSSEPSELVAVKLDDCWFLTLRKGDPSFGLQVSEGLVQRLNATDALLLASKVAYRVIHESQCTEQSNGRKAALAESVLIQLETAIRLAGDSPPHPKPHNDYSDRGDCDLDEDDEQVP